MTIDIKVPALPESVSDATVAVWHKQPGDAVKRDEPLLDLETDKVMLEVPAPQDGILGDILKQVGTVVTPNEVLATLKEGADAASTSAHTSAPEKSAEASPPSDTTTASQPAAAQADLSPAVRRMVTENNLDVTKITGTGKAGRINKEDVLAHMSGGSQLAKSASAEAATSSLEVSGDRTEKRVPMSRLRARVAERLMEVQQNTAMLTTFNEVDMKPVMDLRARHQEAFQKNHGVKLGFMSFFVKAVVEALKRFPVINASIDGSDIVYHGYYDIGIAVSTPRGLVVPVIRDADALSMADIEKSIVAYAEKARDAKLTMEDMTGGTFTITNGGTFGSMLSTPILNSPQSAILGMHNIVKRPVVENDQIVIRPIMYLAMSYDHRLIDGRDSVTFLLTIKQLLEDPSRLLLGI
ncbi:MAG: dihydrolipoamide acetyltransferase [Gammaproteobacteria bacterium]|nr:dihydrolipoamide acetyltransferase [Gammaproteobacteria bacterium]